MGSRTIGRTKVTWEGTTFVKQEGDVLFFTDAEGGNTDCVNVSTGVIVCTRGKIRMSSPARQQNASASGDGVVYQSGGDQVIRRD